MTDHVGIFVFVKDNISNAPPFIGDTIKAVCWKTFQLESIGMIFLTDSSGINRYT